MDEDNTYFVRCPVHGPFEAERLTSHEEDGIRKPSMLKARLELAPRQIIAPSFESNHGGPHTRHYDVVLRVPHAIHLGRNVRVGQCVAFSEVNRLHMRQLTDDDGCPLSEEIAEPFRLRLDDDLQSDSLDFSTSMRLFRLGNETSFHLQCQLMKCGGICEPLLEDAKAT
ncbi:hypothetical protein AAVH_15832 [Aphelenchoides avenae]|nr:hypothetical protein AAVH_15832 [Aphelenchus avenae]